jgi:hypothetical protein
MVATSFGLPMISRLAGVAELPNTGPFVGVAVFCEKVIQEQNGPMTLVRITDTINQSVVGPDTPREMQPFMANITLVVMLKSGQAKGSFGLMLRPEAPGGFQMPPFEQTIHLQGEAWGGAIVMPMLFPVTSPGVYWFDVLLVDPNSDDSEQLLTRIPLEVLYQRAG